MPGRDGMITLTVAQIYALLLFCESAGTNACEIRALDVDGDEPWPHTVVAVTGGNTVFITARGDAA